MLVEIRIKNFRSFADVALCGCQSLVILVGENDVGKTSLLEAIEILLEKRRPQVTDFRRYVADDVRLGEPIEITGTFRQACNDLPAKFKIVDPMHFSIRRTILRDTSSRLEILGQGFTDARIDGFAKLKAGEQSEILSSLGVNPASNAGARGEQLLALAASGTIPVSEKWLVTNASELAESIPTVSRITSGDYDDPDSQAQAGIADAVRSELAIYQEDQPAAFSDARSVAQNAIAAQINKLRQPMLDVMKGLQAVDASFEVDFRKPQVRGELRVDFGQGFQRLGELGQGTRRRAWIAIQHARSKSVDNQACLRMYDEPDANLHYSAQRALYSAICAARSHDDSVQIIIATHAVTLIDSAPPETIRIIRELPNGEREIEQIGKGNIETGVLSELGEIGRQLGLSNLALLYERAFLLVEGLTEERSIPIFYLKLFGRLPELDGIRIVNLDTCGAWRSVVKIFFAARPGMIHLLLDSDCKLDGSSAKITQSTMGDCGITLADVTFAGSKEFEDEFSNEIWASTLNNDYPRETMAEWIPSDIEALRPSQKFSETLIQVVRQQAVKELRSSVNKPEVGAKLALRCDANDIPASVKAAFSKVRKIAGIL